MMYHLQPGLVKGMDILGLCLDPTVAYLKSHPRAGVQKKDVVQVRREAYQQRNRFVCKGNLATLIRHHSSRKPGYTVRCRAGCGTSERQLPTTICVSR